MEVEPEGAEVEAQLQVQANPFERGSKDLTIFKLVKQAQNKNGVKHSHYGQYRKYARNRLKKIRKGSGISLALKKGKSYIFQKKRLQSAEESNYEGNGLILLLKAEKYWGQAMEKRQLFIDKKNRRARFQVTSKLKRAAYYSKKVFQVASGYKNERTSLEAQAYKQNSFGMLAMERQRWKEALQHYALARQILAEVVKVLDSFDRNVYESVIETIDQSIRYCNFRESKGTSNISADELVQMRLSKNPLVLQKLEALQLAKDDEGELQVSIFGKPIQLKDRALKEKEQNLLVRKAELQVQKDQERRLALYLEMFEIFDSAIEHLSRLKADPKYSAPEVELFESLIGSYKFDRLEKQRERLEEQYSELSTRFEQQQPLKLGSVLISKKALKLKLIKPHSLIKLCENIVFLCDSQSQILKRQTLSSSQQVDKTAQFFGTAKKIYLGLILICKEKHQEALQFLLRARAQVRDKPVLQPILSNYLCKALVEYHLAKGASTSEGPLLRDIAELKLGEQMPAFSLYQKLKESRPIGPADRTLPVVRVPAPLQLLPPRPIFLDVCSVLVEYPSLQQRTVQKGSFWSKLNIFKR